MSTTLNVWTYRVGVDAGVSGKNVVGYGVEALDGSIGKVDDATYDVSGSFVVVDTGPWILGKKVVLPAGVIRDVDHDDEKIFVNRTKEQIKNAPEFERTTKALDDEYPAGLARTTGLAGLAIATGTTSKRTSQATSVVTKTGGALCRYHPSTSHHPSSSSFCLLARAVRDLTHFPPPR